MFRNRLAPLLLAALAASGWAAGCATAPLDAGRTDYRLADGFAARRPASVAVLAVTGEIPEGAAAALREELRAVLLDRRYAPLRDATVDGSPGEYRPGGPAAVLELSIDRWDDAALYGAGIVKVTATARLHAAGTGEVLYECRLRDVRVNAHTTAMTMEDRPRCVDGAAEDAVDRLLADLPAKGDG